MRLSTSSTTWSSRRSGSTLLGSTRLKQKLLRPWWQNTAPVDLAGLPTVALRIPGDTHLPASLKVIGRPGSEESLLAMALLRERVAQTLK